MLFNPVVGGKKLPALTDPAAAADIMQNKQAIDQSGQIITGTKAPLPTLTNPGSAGDLLSGKQLLNQGGNIVTGTITTRSSSSLTASGSSIIVPAGYYPLPGQQVCRHGDPGDAEHFRQFQWFDHRLRHPVRRICQLRHQECHEAAYHPGREDHYAVHIYANCRVLRQIHHGSDYRLRERQPDCRQYPGRREYLWGDRQSGLRRTILCGDGQLHR